MQPNVTTLHLPPKSNLIIGSPVADFTHSDLIATTGLYLHLPGEAGGRAALEVVWVEVDLFIHETRVLHHASHISCLWKLRDLPCGINSSRRLELYVRPSALVEIHGIRALR